MLTNALLVHVPDRAASPTVRLMGSFSVFDRGERIDLPGDAQRLVAFLAINRDRVPRAYVAGTLWIEGNQDRAFGNLRSALWRVRRVAERLIDADAQNLGLTADAAIDVDTVMQVGNRICSQDRVGSTPECDLELFTQELLPGWYDDWAIVERERLRQTSLHALEALADRWTAISHFAAAIQAALAAIRLDPLRESAHRCLIRIHIAEGNYSEAIRHYHEYAERMRSDLGIEPSPQLRDLLRTYALV